MTYQPLSIFLNAKVILEEKQQWYYFYKYLSWIKEFILFPQVLFQRWTH